MEIEEILELERKNEEQKLKSKLSQAKRENQQKLLNIGITIISMQMQQNTAALFAGIFNDNN